MPTTADDLAGLTILGHKAAADRTLESFPNHNAGRRYTITFVTDEFSCVCPATGQPDYATITIKYIPDQRIVESKSLKLYLWSYRNEGVFQKHLINTICDDLVAAVDPHWIEVTGALRRAAASPSPSSSNMTKPTPNTSAANPAATPLPMVRGYKYYPWVMAIFVTALIVSNIVAVKLIAGRAAAVLRRCVIFSISYIFGDVLTEVYGYRPRAAGHLDRLCLQPAGGGGVYLAGLWPAAPDGLCPASPRRQAQGAYNAILGSTPADPGGVAAGLPGRRILNSFVVAKLKSGNQGAAGCGCAPSARRSWRRWPTPASLSASWCWAAYSPGRGHGSSSSAANGCPK